MSEAEWKQFLKDAPDATALYGWAIACMEVRGLIDIAGAPATRKRRSDAGQSRVTISGTQSTVEAVRERLQPSLSGLPDEDRSK